MYISSIKNFNNVINFGTSAPKRYITKPALNKDVFEKSTEVKSDFSDIDFEEWSNETCFYSQIDKIFTDENYLGSGRSSSVFKIPGSENFVARIHNTGSALSGIKNYANKHKKKSDWFIKNVETDLSRNFGQQVAVVTCADDVEKQIQIILYQKGEPVGVPPELVADTLLSIDKNYPEYQSTGMKKKYSSSMSSIAQLPESAYVEYIKSLIELQKNNYIFDSSNSNNLLIDPENKSIGIVDIVKMHNIGVNLPLDLGFGLYSLINYGYFSTYIQDKVAPIPKEEISKTKSDIFEIISKYLSAMKKTNQKFSIEDSIIRKMLTSDLFGEYFDNYCPANNYIDLKKSGLL